MAYQLFSSPHDIHQPPHFIFLWRRRRRPKAKPRRRRRRRGRRAKTTALAKRARPVTLVTGGTGFLGSHLVRLLVEEGVKNVRVLATSAPAWLEELGVEVVDGLDHVAGGRGARGRGRGGDLSPRGARLARAGGRAPDVRAARRRDARCCARRRARAGVKSIVLASTSGTVAVTEDGDVRARRGVAARRSTSSRAGPTTRASSIRSASRSRTSRATGAASSS